MHTDFKSCEVLSFDCYGTMIDWEEGIWGAFQPIIQSNNATQITRQSALQSFAKIETTLERENPTLRYDHLLSEVHSQFAKQQELETTTELNNVFGQSVKHWPAFNDSTEALQRLKQHFKLVILSNVNRSGFAESNKKLGIEFDAIYTAEDIGAYKPNSRNFDYLIEHGSKDLGVTRESIFHVAQSLHHDHVPASRVGLKKIWIDRQNLENSDAWGATAVVPERPEIDYRFTTLKEFADAVLGA